MKYLLALVLGFNTVAAYSAVSNTFSQVIAPAIVRHPEIISGEKNVRVSTEGLFAIAEIGKYLFRTEVMDSSKAVVETTYLKTGSNGENPQLDNQEASDCDKCQGSIIMPDIQVLGEVIPLPESGLKLIYSSKNAIGFSGNGHIQIPLSDSSSAVTAMRVSGTFAGGRTFNSSNPTNTPNVNYDFIWNQKDGSGNLVLGSTLVDFTVYYTAYGREIPINYQLRVGGFRALFQRIGGWLPSGWHYLDRERNVLILSDLSSEKVDPKNISGEFFVPSKDGSEVYVFNSQGLHLRTLTPKKGVTKTLFQYNGSGQLVSITNKYGQVTTLQRNLTTGNVEKIIAPKGQETELYYDSYDQLVGVKNSKLQQYTMEYTAANKGLLSKFTKPNGEYSSFTYDAYGALLSDVHSGGASQTLTKTFSGTDHFSRWITMTSSEGRTYVTKMQNTLLTTGETHFIKELSNGGFLNDRNGKILQLDIDRFKMVTRNLETDPQFKNNVYLAKSTTSVGKVSYVSSRKKEAALSDPLDLFSLIKYKETYKQNSSISTKEYFPNTNSWTLISGEGRKSTSKMNSLEDVVETQQGSLLPVKYEYKSDGKISKVTQGDRVFRYDYDSFGFLSKSVDPQGRVTSYVNDSVGNVLSITSPEGRKTKIQYDSNNKITKIVLPDSVAGNKEHIFVYNQKELLSSYNPPIVSGGGPTQYEYNNDNDLIKTTLPDERVINYNYTFPAGHLTSIETQEEELNFSYQYERVSEIQISGRSYLNANIKQNYSYYGDKIGMMSLGPLPGGLYSSVEYKYNSNLMVDKVNLRDASGGVRNLVQYSYDKDNLISRVSDLEIKRNDQGQAKELSLKNAKLLYGYDSSYGELSKIELNYKNAPYEVKELKRDRLGRLIEESSVEGSYVYHYDKAGRFTGKSAKYSGQSVSSYNYDKNGNRVSGFENNKNFTAKFDNQDRLIKFNNTTYSYNPVGSLAQKVGQGITTNYSYDSFGNLRGVSNGSINIEYDTDYEGRRIAKRINGNVVLRYAWLDQLRVGAELDSNGVLLKQFVYSDGVNSPDYMIMSGKKYLFGKDHRGSITMVVDSETGEIKQKIKYADWGEVLEDTNPGFQPFGYAGGLYDNHTKLYRFGAREYDPEIGRWLSKDPIRFNGGDANLYGYVLQDPINLLDSNGKESRWSGGGPEPFGGLGIIAVGAAALVAGKCAGPTMTEITNEVINQENPNVDNPNGDENSADVINN